MATLRNRRKLAALNKENFKEHLRSNLSQNSNVPRSKEDYIAQVSEQIEGRATKKLSQEFSTTENRILGALSLLSHMNPLFQDHYGTTPETSRNAYDINQGTNEDDSQSDHHSEAGVLQKQTTRNSGPEDGHDNKSFIHYGWCQEWFSVVNITLRNTNFHQIFMDDVFSSFPWMEM